MLNFWVVKYLGLAWGVLLRGLVDLPDAGHVVLCGCAQHRALRIPRSKVDLGFMLQFCLHLFGPPCVQDHDTAEPLADYSYLVWTSLVDHRLKDRSYPLLTTARFIDHIKVVGTPHVEQSNKAITPPTHERVMVVSTIRHAVDATRVMCLYLPRDRLMLHIIDGADLADTRSHYVLRRLATPIEARDGTRFDVTFL